MTASKVSDLKDQSSIKDRLTFRSNNYIQIPKIRLYISQSFFWSTSAPWSRPRPDRSGLAWTWSGCGLDLAWTRSGLVWTGRGLDWSGTGLVLVWTGLDWSGLDVVWIGLDPCGVRWTDSSWRSCSSCCASGKRVNSAAADVEAAHSLTHSVKGREKPGETVGALRLCQGVSQL